MDFKLFKHIREQNFTGGVPFPNSDTLFYIREFSGEYPIESQKYWGRDFKTLNDARDAAKEVYAEGLSQQDKDNFSVCVFKGESSESIEMIGKNKELDAEGK